MDNKEYLVRGSYTGINRIEHSADFTCKGDQVLSIDYIDLSTTIKRHVFFREYDIDR